MQSGEIEEANVSEANVSEANVSEANVSEQESSLTKYIDNINNNNSILVIENNDNNHEILDNILNSKETDHIVIDVENLFECLTTQKSSSLLIINNFAPENMDEKELTKIMNILKQLVLYGQSIIVYYDESSDFFTNKDIFIF